MSEPRPASIIVCAECRQDWARHKHLAVERWLDEHGADSQAMTYENRAELRAEAEAKATVTNEECVKLLLVANQGPPGPVGAMGATGASARPTDIADAIDRHVLVEHR